MSILIKNAIILLMTEEMPSTFTRNILISFYDDLRLMDWPEKKMC
ncbi:hypothetical protein SAMN04489735_104213 [Aneurinibacillus thermoaerophilus]|uniref:Uncharacterized protein n=1 Tax=Aneurinibacillus thermoaerophilus TaxID=143495 RepID=A0A1G8ECB8_ANETH|nr:hypothetical protein SAMN04489735_104213 [Aneurinibacillus thermoaerophilus]